MPPFKPSLPSIDEDPSNTRGSSQPRYNAKRSNARHNRPRRSVASIANGPGGFLHPNLPDHNNYRKAPIMADAESTARLEAAAPASAQVTESQQNQQHPTAQSFRLPNIDASTAPTSAQPNDPKLDPAGFFVHVNNTKFGDASPSAEKTYHPRIQYIFADDDPAVLSAALADAHTRNTASTASARANPMREHGVLVDVEPVTDPKTGKPTGGWKVASAGSISGDFAITEAQITRMDDSSSAAAVAKAGAEADIGGTMWLKLHGVEMTDDDDIPADSLPGSQSGEKSVSGEKEDYSGLIEQFDRQMVIIKKIMTAGQARIAKNSATDEQQHDQPEAKGDGKDLDGDESG